MPRPTINVFVTAGRRGLRAARPRGRPPGGGGGARAPPAVGGGADPPGRARFEAEPPDGRASRADGDRKGGPRVCERTAEVPRVLRDVVDDEGDAVAAHAADAALVRRDRDGPVRGGGGG